MKIITRDFTETLRARLAGFLKHYPESVPIIIGSDNVNILLQSPDVNFIIREGDLL